MEFTGNSESDNDNNYSDIDELNVNAIIEQLDDNVPEIVNKVNTISNSTGITTPLQAVTSHDVSTVENLLVEIIEDVKSIVTNADGVT